MNLLDFPGHDDMNKRIRNLILSIYIILFSVDINTQTLVMRAPELFGDASMYLVRSRDAMYGVISAPGALFAFNGEIEQKEITCKIIQIAGERVRGEYIKGKYEHGVEAPVPCYAVLRNGKWIGWIDFRGHKRAFCAADSLIQLPDVCRLRP